jgi:pyrophosphatase PpaX
MPQGLSLATFQAVLFDVDGTLVDSLEALVAGLADTYEKIAGIRPPDEEIKSLIGLPLRKQLTLYRNSEPTDEELADAIDFAIERFEANKHLERIIEPAVETLRLCKRVGLKTALVTSKTRKELELFLTRFPAADAVDVTVTASDVFRPKPAPDCALLACERLDVNPANAAMIGDSVYDLRCASAAGIATVAVGYGSAPQTALLAERPDAFFETPEELRDWARDAFLETTCPERN